MVLRHMSHPRVIYKHLNYFFIYLLLITGSPILRVIHNVFSVMDPSFVSDQFLLLFYK